LRPPPPALALETRARRPIANELRPELPREILDANTTLFARERPRARLRSITNTYNCVGMVVGSRRVWIDPADLIRILVEDGYRKLNGLAEAQFGDVVVYRNAKREVVHVGIVIGKNLYDPEAVRDPLVVLSKWGGAGEYEHDLSDVPVQLGSPAEFWTDRKGT
jgi:hypothetical protein